MFHYQAVYTASECVADNADDSYIDTALVAFGDNAPNWGRVFISRCDLAKHGANNGEANPINCQYFYTSGGHTQNQPRPCGFHCPDQINSDRWVGNCEEENYHDRYLTCDTGPDFPADYCIDTPEDYGYCGSG